MANLQKKSSLLANLVFSNNIAGSVSAPVLTEVCVVVVIVDTILEAEGVRLLMVVIMVAAAAVNHRAGVGQSGSRQGHRAQSMTSSDGTMDTVRTN